MVSKEPVFWLISITCPFKDAVVKLILAVDSFNLATVSFKLAVYWCIDWLNACNDWVAEFIDNKDASNPPGLKIVTVYSNVSNLLSTEVENGWNTEPVHVLNDAVCKFKDAVTDSKVVSFCFWEPVHAFISTICPLTDADHVLISVTCPLILALNVFRLDVDSSNLVNLLFWLVLVVSLLAVYKFKLAVDSFNLANVLSTDAVYVCKVENLVSTDAVYVCKVENLVSTDAVYVCNVESFISCDALNWFNDEVLYSILFNLLFKDAV